MKFETPDQKLMDVYSSFDKDVIENILNALLPDRKFVKETPPTEKIAAIQKGTLLFTAQELQHLVRNHYCYNNNNIMYIIIIIKYWSQ